MNSYAPVTGKFISAVWRRIVLVRIAESIAIATAVSSALGLALTPILWWRGQSALPLAVAMLLLGAISGLIWGISRRPTRFQAAVEADRQLNLHDLLGTVYLLSHENKPDNFWADAIALTSDNQCRSLRPSDVVVNQLGLRAWGGVGILGALLITMGLFTARPINVTAASVAESNSPTLPQNIQPSFASANQSQDLTARPPGTGGTDDIANRGAEQNQPDDSHNDSPEPNRAQSHSVTGSNSSTGGGAAITHSLQPPLESPTIGHASAGLTHSGLSAAGQSDSHANIPGDSNATTATEIANHRSPPWTSNQWSEDTAAAQAAINSGKVPDSDADLVRDFFRRD